VPCSSISAQCFPINDLIPSHLTCTHFPQSTSLGFRHSHLRNSYSRVHCLSSKGLEILRAGEPIFPQICVDKDKDLSTATCPPTPYFARFSVSCEAAAAPCVCVAACMYLVVVGCNANLSATAKLVSGNTARVPPLVRSAFCACGLPIASFEAVATW
jgi:hypothetical protein